MEFLVVSSMIYVLAKAFKGSNTVEGYKNKDGYNWIEFQKFKDRTFGKGGLRHNNTLYDTLAAFGSVVDDCPTYSYIKFRKINFDDTQTTQQEKHHVIKIADQTSYVEFDWTTQKMLQHIAANDQDLQLSKKTMMEPENGKIINNSMYDEYTSVLKCYKDLINLTQKFTETQFIADASNDIIQHIKQKPTEEFGNILNTYKLESAQKWYNQATSGQLQQFEEYKQLEKLAIKIQKNCEQRCKQLVKSFNNSQSVKQCIYPEELFHIPVKYDNKHFQGVTETLKEISQLSQLVGEFMSTSTEYEQSDFQWNYYHLWCIFDYLKSVSKHNPGDMLKNKTLTPLTAFIEMNIQRAYNSATQHRRVSDRVCPVTQLKRDIQEVASIVLEVLQNQKNKDEYDLKLSFHCRNLSKDTLQFLDVYTLQIVDIFEMFNQNHIQAAECILYILEQTKRDRTFYNMQEWKDGLKLIKDLNNSNRNNPQIVDDYFNNQCVEIAIYNIIAHLEWAYKLSKQNILHNTREKILVMMYRRKECIPVNDMFNQLNMLIGTLPDSQQMQEIQEQIISFNKNLESLFNSGQSFHKTYVLQTQFYNYHIVVTNSHTEVFILNSRTTSEDLCIFSALDKDRKRDDFLTNAIASVVKFYDQKIPEEEKKQSSLRPNPKGNNRQYYPQTTQQTQQSEQINYSQQMAEFIKQRQHKSRDQFATDIIDRLLNVRKMIQSSIEEFDKYFQDYNRKHNIIQKLKRQAQNAYKIPNTKPHPSKAKPVIDSDQSGTQQTQQNTQTVNDQYQNPTTTHANQLQQPTHVGLVKGVNLSARRDSNTGHYGYVQTSNSVNNQPQQPVHVGLATGFDLSAGRNSNTGHYGYVQTSNSVNNQPQQPVHVGSATGFDLSVGRSSNTRNYGHMQTSNSVNSVQQSGNQHRRLINTGQTLQQYQQPNQGPYTSILRPTADIIQKNDKSHSRSNTSTFVQNNSNMNTINNNRFDPFIKIPPRDQMSQLHRLQRRDSSLLRNN